jgi:orotate phosphoribosyltransferase
MVRAMMNPANRERLRAIIADKALIKGDGIRLASGATSSFYLDMRVVSLDAEGATLIGELMIDRLAGTDTQAIGGLETGAIAVVAATIQAGFRRGQPIAGFYVRKKAKEHGTGKLIEGNLPKAGRVVLLEDVMTSGESVIKALDAVREAGCVVERIITVVDRQAGATETLARHGVALESLFTRADFGV